VLIEVGLEDIPELTFAGLRYGVGFLCLLPFSLASEGLLTLKSLPRRSWIELLSLWILFHAFTQGAQFLGLFYLPAVTVNLALALTPVFVSVLGIVFLAERPSGFSGEARRSPPSVRSCTSIP
jgi:drug/metabolite transporter (DMT)-like permease